MSKKEIEIPLKQNADQYYRYKMPPLQNKNLKSGNGIKTTILNLKAIAEAIGRTPESISQWYSYSLGVQTKIVQDGNQLYLNGNHQQKILLAKLYEFIDTFVICPACSNPETHYSLQENKLYLQCKSCGNTMPIKLNKGVYFIKMNKWISIHIDKERSDVIKPKKDDVNIQNDDDVLMDIDELEKLANELSRKSDKLPTKEDQDEFFEKIKKMVKNESFKDAEICRCIQNFQNKWCTDERWLLLVIFHALFEDNPNDMLNIIDKRSILLIMLLSNEYEQKTFLSILTKFISITNPALLTSAPIIFYTLFDKEIIECNGFKSWFKKPSKSLEGGQKVSENIRNVILKDFSKWIEESHYEEDVDTEIEEEQNENSSEFNIDSI